MTSGTLMPNIVSELAPVQASPIGQDTSSVKSAGSNESAGKVKSGKLPYQASHQVELLHLQAEIDALLQQLQSLKQQRISASDHSLEAQESEVPALV